MAVSEYRSRRCLAMLLAAATLAGCSASTEESRLLQGDVAVAYARRPVSGAANEFGNPTNAQTFVRGGDLFIRERNSPKATLYNVTGAITRGDGDVADIEVSYDGTRMLFAMRCGPASHPVCSGNATWNIWEYVMTGGVLNGTLRQLTNDPVFDDIDPVYLPNGSIVFSSNRQEKSRTIMANMGLEPFSYRDENRSQRASVLHVMDPGGGNIRQISFNPSHDRNPSVRMNGRILYSRWDHAGDRNLMSLYTMNPDGSGMDIQYGAHTPGSVCFLHPRETQGGQIMSTVMPLTGTNEGGALALINAGARDNAQSYPTFQRVPLDASFAPDGRFTTPYPLWDGSGRALVSWTPPRPVNGANGTPAYGVKILNLADKTLISIDLPEMDNNFEPTQMLVDPVPIVDRAEPAIVQPVNANGALGTRWNKMGQNTGVGIINIQSVYFTDTAQGLQRMGDEVLALGIDFPVSFPFFNGIPPTFNKNPDGSINIDLLKDPLSPLYVERPARFIRVTRAVPTPPVQPANPGVHASIFGIGSGEMQELLGYVEVEPDGSAKFEVPADMPLSLQVVDSEGRAFAMHDAWIQLRPGEVLQCTGCHESHTRNYAPAAVGHTYLPANRARAGTETMAETRYPPQVAGNVTVETGAVLAQDLVFTSDPWSATPPAMNGTEVLIRYQDLPSDLTAHAAWTNPVITEPDGMGGNVFSRIVLNYKNHIQPVFDLRCAGCHSGMAPPGGLDLSVPDPAPASGWVLSYEHLMRGSGGRGPRISVGGPLSGSRYSFLVEVLYHQKIRVATSRTLPATNHSTFLNDAERRLIVEWIDTGARYYNDPYLPDPNNNGLKDLSELRGINQ